MNNPEFSSEKEPDAYKQAERFTDALEKLKQVRQAFFDERSHGADCSQEDLNEMFNTFEGKFTEHILQLADVSKLGWNPVPEYQETMENNATGDLIIDPYKKIIARAENTAVDEDSLEQSEQSMEYSVKAGLISQTIVDVKIEIYDEVASGSHPNSILFPNKHIISDEPLESEPIELDGYKAKALADVIEYVVDRLSTIYNDSKWYINPADNNPGKYVIEEI